MKSLDSIRNTSDRARYRSGERRKDPFAVVAHLKVPPANWKKSPGSKTEDVAQGGLPSSCPNTGGCRVCLANNYRLNLCSFAAREDKFVICEAIWKNIMSLSVRSSGS